jgi:hypothetical protein
MTQSKIVATDELVRESLLVIQSGPFADSYQPYLERGYSPLPIRSGAKRPIINAWSAFCERQPTLEEAEPWARQYPGAGIGIALGYRGLIGMDFDSDDEEINGAIREVLPEHAHY